MMSYLKIPAILVGLHIDRVTQKGDVHKIISFSRFAKSMGHGEEDRLRISNCEFEKTQGMGLCRWRLEERCA